MATHSSQSAAWTADRFADPASYTVTLGDGERRRLLGAVSAWRDRGPQTPVETLGRDALPLGSLDARLEALYEEVRAGRGFVVIGGLPVDDVSLEDFTAAVWAIGTRFGTALSQSAAGELIGHVIDATAEDPTPRMFRSNLELRAHNDITAMLSLACWHTSKSGGESVLVSGVTVHDAIERRAPHLLEPLYRGYHYHRMGEEGPGEEESTPFRVPVFAQVEGDLSVRYQRTGIAAGHRALGLPLEETDIEAFNLFDATALDPKHRLAFTLPRGSMLVLNNYVVMHARKRFANHADPAKVRRLVRLWHDAPGFRRVPREFNHFSANGVPPQEGRQCTYDFRQLYEDDPAGTGGVPDMRLDDAVSR